MFWLIFLLLLMGVMICVGCACLLPPDMANPVGSLDRLNRRALAQLINPFLP